MIMVEEIKEALDLLDNDELRKYLDGIVAYHEAKLAQYKKYLNEENKDEQNQTPQN